ncbi:MAG TPA: acyl-CoA desaturase [Kofleriaceae bacterium]
MNAYPELGGLRAELRASGCFEHHELRTWLKLVVLGSALAATLVAMHRQSLGVAIALVPVAGLFATSLAMMGHEGSHKSFSRSAWRNTLLTHLMFPLFSGLGALYWKNKHDKLHHGHPNVEGIDPDIQPWPFVSSRGDHERASPRLRWFQRNLQRQVFWPMTTLMTFGMRRSSILYLAKYPGQHGYTRQWFAEVACMTVHYVGWLVVPSLVLGPLVAFTLYAGVWAVVGVGLALVFAPAHMGLPVTHGQHHDWIHQLETTRDLALPRVVSFFFIGLDYQVEHHLFPKIPHQNLPRAAALTRAWCQRHGLPHLTWAYPAALVDSARFMATAWAQHAQLPVDVRAAHIVV